MLQPTEITIHDIAKKLGISASTVSRALNNNPVISEKTRMLIKQTAEEMGYRPNTMAANFRNKSTHTIGVIVPLINRHFFSSVISGIEEVAYNKGFAVIISQSNDNYEKENKIARSLFANRVDGVILSIGMETKSTDHLKLFSERQIPIVFFDRATDEFDAHKIVVDDYGGGYRATKHLIEQGAKNIAHIGGPLHLNIYENRQKGYLDALSNAGLKVDESMIVNNSLTRADGTHAIQKLLSNLQKNGMKVPEDIAIVGFSNEPFSEVVTPSISTIKQPGFSMGRKAAELIIHQIINKKSKPVFKTIVMPTELIIRNSSRKKA